MKKVIKNILSIMLALLVGMMPATEVIAKQTETAHVLEHFEYDAVDSDVPGTKLFSFSLLGASEQEPVTPSLSEVMAAYRCTNLTDASTYLKEQMLNREAHIVLAFQNASYNYANGDLTDTYYGAIAHTGVGNEGDYLWSNIAKIDMTSCSYTDYVAFVFDINWRTTKAQEDELTQKIAAIEKNIEKGHYGTDEDIIIPVYQYLMTNMTYDTESYNKHQNGLDDAVSDLSYTAYAAATKKMAVCTGFASLMYRILLDKGIDCRLLNSDTHCWNAVKCEGKWYECDVTSDLQDSTRNMAHLLKGSRTMNASMYIWKYSKMPFYDEIKEYDWADDDYYSLANMTVRGFKAIVTHTKSNKADKQSIKLVDASGTKLKEGVDYKITYKKNSFASRTMIINGLGKYSGSTLNADYKVKLAAPKIKKIERQFNKSKTKVRFKVTFDKSYGANYYELRFDNGVFKEGVLDTRKSKKNYIYTCWHTTEQLGSCYASDAESFYVEAGYVNWSDYDENEDNLIVLQGAAKSTVKTLPKGKNIKTFR